MNENAQEASHTPNHIPRAERIKCLFFSLVLIGYGTFGLMADDIYIPGKRGRGMHFHGVSCWIMYAAFFFGAINLISVVADHYDKRNNETNYRQFARVSRWIGWGLFIVAIIAGIVTPHA